MIIQKLVSHNLISPPRWLPLNVHYLTMMGSVAYGVSGDTSDMDVYGFCVPPKHIVFPHLAGHIPGFGPQPEKFEVWQEHHVKSPDGAREYDFAVYSIVRFFQLCMENNPNMVDSLFTPRRCVLHSTPMAEHVRANRQKFLHKGSFHKFRGYAAAQMSKIKNGRTPLVTFIRERGLPHTLTADVIEAETARRMLDGQGHEALATLSLDEVAKLLDLFRTHRQKENAKRWQSIVEHGFDTKFAYHVVRLGLECQQILETGDLDIERDREVLKAIRRGEWTLERIEAWGETQERLLNDLYAKSTLPHSPDDKGLRDLLLECLEMHYGSLADAVKLDPTVEAIINDLSTILDRYRPRQPGGDM